MSGTVAIIPVRGTLRTKTRLAAQLDERERMRLMRHMLRHVLDVVDRSGVIAWTFIVSQDADVLVEVPPSSNRWSVVVQAGEGLNAAIGLGRHRAMSGGYGKMAVVLPDLPMLQPADLHAVVSSSAPVVLAPDRHGTGTNALVLRLEHEAGGGLPFAFGAQSLSRHVAACQRLGLAWTTVETTGLQHDLDTPEDWRALPDTVRRSLLTSIRKPAQVIQGKH